MLPFSDVHLFRLTLFLSAALAFVVQPLIAKRLLPLLGGSPAVWNTCLVFFQAALLLGYALADRLVRLRVRVQVGVHLTLLAAAGGLALYGWLTPLHAPGVGESPTGWALSALALTVGAPFLLLSVNSTLLQRWFSLSGAPVDPYSLYRASNLGSFAGLLAFPFAFEPLLTTWTQGALWVGGFALLVVLVTQCGRHVLARQCAADGGAGAAPPERLTWPRRFLWVGLAFVPSSLTLGVTTFISTDLAAVPLLWVIPLALYLLSFAITFGPAPARRLTTMAAYLHPVLAIAVLAILHRPALVPTSGHLILHPLLLFSVGLVAHGRLAASRPSPSRLTEFYLWVAVGGVLGGIFNALVAPLVFDSILEYPLAIALTGFILPMALPGSRTSVVDAALGLCVGLLALATAAVTQRTLPYGPAAIAVIFALPAVVCVMFRDRWLRLGTAMTAILLMTNALPSIEGLLLHRTRTFFGAMRVTSEQGGRFHVFRHGTTTHGRQDRRGAVMRKLPLSYYHVRGPIGQLIQHQRGWNRPLRVGVVGLGIGTMAAYSEKGDHFVFYEIDPEVQRIAETAAWFSYLADSQARPQIVLGDARLSLARAAPERFDLLLLDAFSSDSIPVHLLTREAFHVYRRHLGPEGLVITHVSNRHLEMRPTVVSTAASVGLSSVEQVSVASPEASAAGYAGSRWVASGTAEALAANGLPTDSWVTSPDRPARPWTDDFSNLAGVIVWRR